MSLSRISRAGDGWALEAGIHSSLVGEEEGHMVARGRGARWVVGRALAPEGIVAGKWAHVAGEGLHGQIRRSGNR